MRAENVARAHAREHARAKPRVREQNPAYAKIFLANGKKLKVFCFTSSYVRLENSYDFGSSTTSNLFA